MPPLMTVVPGPNVRGGEVAIWERHPAHPDGELYVAHGDGPTPCAPTPLVSDRISKGRLVQVAQPTEAATPPPTPTPEQQPTDDG